MKFFIFNPSSSITNEKSILNQDNKITKKSNPTPVKANLISFAFLFIAIIHCCNFSEAKSLNKKINLNFLNNAEAAAKNFTFPEKLPKYSLLNFTDYNLFETLMLNLKINRIEAKEIFHIVDRNEDGYIKDEEWEQFYEIFVKPFVQFDKNKDNLLNFQEFKDALNKDDKKRFKNMLEMNKKFCDEEVLLKRIFRVINLNMDGGINFAEYLKLRKYNNAYDICLVKEKKINYKNFPVMVHFVYKKLKYYSTEDLKKIYNRTIDWSYLKSPNKTIDFATFCTLMNLMKIYQESNFNTQGFINYFNLYSSGLTIHTYSLIQNFAKLIVKEDLVFKSLNFGVKINSIVQYDPKKQRTQNNFADLKIYSSKISLENLFLLYRFFEMIHFNHIRFPYTLGPKLFSQCLESSRKNPPQKEEEVLASFLKNSSDLIEKSFQDFQAVGSAAGAANTTREDFDRSVFNILDLNNSTFLEIYELMLLDKAASLFTILSEDMVIPKNQEEDNAENNMFTRKLKEYNVKNVYQISENEIQYLFHMNTKFNPGKINFHQFLFLYSNRLKFTNNLVTRTLIENYLNYFGFYISEAKRKEIIAKYDIKDLDFMSYLLGVKEYMKFYSDNS